MAQDAYHVTKAMRDFGLDADLLIPMLGVKSSTLDRDSTIADPAWEDPRMKDAPWIRRFYLGGKAGRATRLATLFRLMREYDVVFCHTPSSLYAQFFRVPYVPYDAGLIRYLHHSKRIPIPGEQTVYSKVRLQLLARSYQRAARLLFTNPDTYPFFNLLKIGDDRLRFVPFLIDCERYKPVEQKDAHEGLVFFSPARHVWSEKGSWKMLKAYKEYEKRHDDTKLVLIRWGRDLKQSLDLIKSLRIKTVEFRELVPKPHLIKYYQDADVVLDQFVLGSYGTATPEAMACGAPVITYLNPLHERCYGEPAPVMNSFTVKEIYAAMERLREPSLREEMGRKGREYVLKHHNADKVVKIHLQVAKEIFEG